MDIRVERFWRDFLGSHPAVDSARFHEAFSFGDSEALADELAALVLAGEKRATASLLWTYESRRSEPPRTGDLSVVTSWEGEPLCVIETLRVDIVPFKAVTAEFAALEGEGDRSLESWRHDHAAFFSRECSRIGRSFSTDAPVVCERFAVVHADGRRRNA